MRNSEFVAVCARIARNGLVAAEASALVGGEPDTDGVAECGSIDAVSRAAYVRLGVSVIARGSSFADVVDRVASAQFDADEFRIDVHDPSSRIGLGSTQVAVAVADVIPAAPDLDRPRHRFVVIACADGTYFGEVVTSSDAAYRLHDSKPWSTSSSLDARFSRALVNLVPAARTILDPCCGAGSIVLEAASLGVEAYGVDWKPAMVGMTRENMAHFGYRADVVLADSRTHVRPVEAIVTDLPYGHAIQSDEATVRAILEHGATLAPVGVYVAPRDITGWLDAAGYTDVEVHTVEKRAGFTRWVHVARSRTVQ